MKTLTPTILFLKVIETAAELFDSGKKVAELTTSMSDSPWALISALVGLTFFGIWALAKAASLAITGAKPAPIKLVPIFYYIEKISAKNWAWRDAEGTCLYKYPSKQEVVKHARSQSTTTSNFRLGSHVSGSPKSIFGEGRPD